MTDEQICRTIKVPEDRLVTILLEGKHGSIFINTTNDIFTAKVVGGVEIPDCPNMYYFDRQKVEVK
jgi:hypothetical protein